MKETLLGRRGRTALLILGMLAGVVIVLIVYAVIVSAQQTSDIRSTQLEGTPTGKKLVTSADRILDCTDPDGECFKRSQQQTADILSSAQRIIILSAACSASVSPDQTVDERIADITNCVTERLTRPKS